MNDKHDPFLSAGVAVVVIILGAWMSFAAPCGCYAGTPVKDVPARCTDIGGPTR